MSASGGPHPLRPYYASTDDSMSFVATVPKGSSTNSTATGTTSVRSHPYQSPYPSNRYLSAASDPELEDISANTGIKDMARALLVGAAFQYTSTCLAMPFEVGKLLLQIQWVPRDEVWVAFSGAEREDEMIQLDSHKSTTKTNVSRRPIGRNEWNDGESSQSEENGSPESLEEGNEWAEDGRRKDFGAEEDELSDEEDAEAYFRDLTSTSARPANEFQRSRTQRKTDASGYVMRKSIYEDGTRPDFVMPVVVRGGVWEMIKAVGRGKEGWLGLWKGSFTTFIMDACGQIIQPVITTILSFFVPSALTPLPLPYAPNPYRSLALLLASHLLTGVIVSPLDLIRTRLIAQSTLPPHRKYSSPWNALRQILSEEGGWRTTYFHPNLLIPTVLDYIFRPLFSLGAPLFIEHKLRLDPASSPVRYSLAEFSISTASLLVTLPIETVRRRLQLQARAAWGRRIAKVHGSRPRPNHRSSLSASERDPLVASASLSEGRNDADHLQGGTNFFASVTGAIPKPVYGKPLRTCVETRPKPYDGVMEAIYRILTEETSTTPVKKQPPLQQSPNDEISSTLVESGILAKQGHSSFGGLYSLYRGLGFAVGANALVFVLTIVTGERAHATAGWAEI